MIVVKFLPSAQKELLNLPEKLQDEIFHKAGLLKQFPEMGQKMEKAYQRYRYLLAGSNQFRVIYKITSPTLIEIAYIRHCRRQMGLRSVLQ